MIFKRKIYKKLLEWKNECNGEKALLIEGARRIADGGMPQAVKANMKGNNFSTIDNIKRQIINLYEED